jgi:hypothetical protein
VGDVVLLLSCAFATSFVGVAFLAYTRPLVQWLARLNFQYWRDHKLLGTPPSRSRIGWLEAASEDPKGAPEMLWLMRAMGAVALLFAATFIIGAILIVA